MTTLIEHHSDFIERRPEDPGLGMLVTEQGWLPLQALTATAEVSGHDASVTVRQSFTNPFTDPIEAVYIHPLPDRAAVVSFAVVIGDRRIEGKLSERGQARADYDQALASGHRAAITEEERPDVFTTRVGNLQPGDRAEVELTLAQPLPWEDGRLTFRFPLVVAPRYIPGSPLDGPSVGEGVALDTNAVPDASRITPPVLLPGLANPVDLDVRVTFPAGLPDDLAASLHAVAEHDTSVALKPGERLDRDFILRWSPATTGTINGGDPTDEGEQTPGRPTTFLTATPDDDADVPGDGTFTFNLLPPESTVDAAPVARSRDVVLVLDRSGSMSGWKMVAARRAAGRIIDSLGPRDRFTVLAFDHAVERPTQLDSGLVAASDRNRWLAIEWLAGLEARGGTELRAPLAEAVSALTSPPPTGDTASGETAAGEAGGATPRSHSTCLVITDGQVGNEDQILAELGGDLGSTRVFTVGIDRAVNTGFLRRLAAVGGGRCELVESEARLDDAMSAIHRRIAEVALESVTITASSGELLELSPAGPVDCFAGVALTIRGRYRGEPPTLAWTGTDPDGAPHQGVLTPEVAEDPAALPLWARARVRDLEDSYAAAIRRTTDREKLADQIVAISLGGHVLSRFTAFVAVDVSETVDSTKPRPVVQPVETPSGWAPQAPPMAAPKAMPMMGSAAPASFSAAPSPAPGGPPPPDAGQPVSRVVAAGSRSRRLLGRKRRSAPTAGGPSSGIPPMESSSPVSPPPVPVVSMTPELDRYADRLEELIARIESGDTGKRLQRDLADLLADLESIDAPAPVIQAVGDLLAEIKADGDPTAAIARARAEIADPGPDHTGPAPDPIVVQVSPDEQPGRTHFWQ